MIVVLAIDALEYNLIEEFDCKHLKQAFYGKTDISEFSEPRTMVLWSSFMTGENKEAEIVSKGTNVDWNFKVPHEKTFFASFQNPCIIDLPGYTYDPAQHEKERKLMKAYFEDGAGTEAIRKEYNAIALAHHREVKKQFLEALNNGSHDLVVGYFSAVDVIGHLNFGNKTMMRILYVDMDLLAKEVAATPGVSCLIVLSDHGMRAIGQYGDHSNYGFWSTDKDYGLKNPKITAFFNLVTKWKVKSGV